jgi:hypothetical protein
MKPVIYALILSLAVCKALAADFTVECFPIKSSFPFVKHLLDQPTVMHEGKPMTFPYSFCGALTQNQIKNYCITSEATQKKASSETVLPNGAVCRIAFLSQERASDLTQIKFKIDISGPGNQTMESEITVVPEQGLLLRCETGKSPKEPEIVVLQIKKQNG